HAVRSMTLYADTLLIPDPVLPWLEKERREERFPLVAPLEAAFLLLHLRPLIDADLPYPAILVFPSWEKTLESKDEATQDGIGRLFLDFFSYYLATRFEDESEIFEFARSQPNEFMRAVAEDELFIAPGGDGTEDIAEAVRLYREHHSHMRS